MSNATILYATGTGNTWRAADVIAKRLSGAGWSVTMKEIRVGADLPGRDFSDDLLILSYTTLGLSMPVGMHKLMRGLRAARRGIPAAIFATWGGDPGAALLQGRGLLRRKGFRVVAASGASYPFNWTQFFNAMNGPDARAMTKEGDAAAERFADGLVAMLGKGSAKGASNRDDAGSALPRVRLPASSALWLPVAWLFFSVAAIAFGAMYAADERCTACGICARACPSGAIFMRGKGKRRRPMWLLRCWACNRCINVCPESAIQTSPFRVVAHLTINVVVIVASVIACNRLAAWAAQPAWITVPGWIVLFIVLVIFLSRVQFVGLEPLFFLLEGIPEMRKLVGRSWTVRFKRYLCQGFEPPRGSTAAQRRVAAHGRGGRATKAR